MSQVTVAAAIDLYALIPLLGQAGIRVPDSVTGGPGEGARTLTWTPDLSTADQATATRLASVTSSAVSITPAEWQAIQSDIDGLITFQNLPNPTLAQVILAVKAQSRILKAILRS